MAGFVMALSGCDLAPRPDAEAKAQREQRKELVAVDVAIARTAAVQPDLEYTGTTQPYRQISLRSQIEGELVDLSIDVGDRVSQGQLLGRLDDHVLATAVMEAQAEGAAREAEVAQARTEVSNARTQVEDARLKLQQAQSDLARYEQLFRAGGIAEQQVETYRTAVGSARQALRSAEENVRTRQQAVTAVRRRVIAQAAIVDREQERQSYSQLKSPVNGVVLERVIEPGNLAQPGSEILKLGDFSQVKVAVQVSELELGNLRPGQSVAVKLDAFPNRAFPGKISRISPAADPTSRLVPVEVTIANSTGTIGSGLLARVNFTQQTVPRVVISETALKTNQDKRSRLSSAASTPARPSSTGTVFVIKNTGDRPIATARQVSLGQRRDGRVEVLSGLNVGDRFITRSSKAINDGDPVKLSILSEQR